MAVEVFQFRGPENYEWVTTENTLNFQLLRGLSVSQWSPFDVTIVDRDEKNQPLLKADILSVRLNSTFIMNNKAMLALKDILCCYGSMLEVKSNDVSLWMYYVSNFVDALDTKKSDIFCSENGTILMIRRHVFMDEAISRHQIFKIPNMRLSPIFFTKDIIDIVEEKKIRGFGFKKVSA